MAWNPSVTDRSGEILAQSLNNATSVIGSAIIGYRQKKQEAEANDAATEYLRKYGAQLGLNAQDDGEIKTAIKAAGGGKQAMQMLTQVQEARQREQLNNAQLAAMTQNQQLNKQREQMNNAQLAVQARNAGAQRVAMGGRASPAELAAMLANGGTFQSTMPGGAGSGDYVRDVAAAGGDVSPEALQAASYLQQQRDAREGFTPSLVEMGNGVTAMMTSKKSAVPIDRGDARPVTQTVEVGGKRYTVGPGNKYFDEQGAPVEFGAEKPMTATEWLMSGGKPEEYQPYRANFAKATSPGAATAAPAAAAAPRQLGLKEQEAYDWAKANPKDPRAKQILQKLGIAQ